MQSLLLKTLVFISNLFFFFFNSKAFFRRKQLQKKMKLQQRGHSRALHFQVPDGKCSCDCTQGRGKALHVCERHISRDASRDWGRNSSAHQILGSKIPGSMATNMGKKKDKILPRLQLLDCSRYNL